MSRHTCPAADHSIIFFFYSSFLFLSFFSEKKTSTSLSVVYLLFFNISRILKGHVSFLLITDCLRLCLIHCWGLCVTILLKVTRSDFMSLKSCIDSTGPCQPVHVVCVLLSANYCVIISWEWPAIDALTRQLPTGTSSRTRRRTALRLQTSKVEWKSPLSPRKSAAPLKIENEAKLLRVTMLCVANNRQTPRNNVFPILFSFSGAFSPLSLLIRPYSGLVDILLQALVVLPPLLNKTSLMIKTPLTPCKSAPRRSPPEVV